MASSWITTRVSARYTLAFQEALFVQAILVGLTTCMMDFGHTHWCALAAFWAHWLAIVMVIIRRPATPTASDLGLIRIGYVPILVFAVFLAPWIHDLIGPQSLAERWLGVRLVPPDGRISIAVWVVCFGWILTFLILAAVRKRTAPTIASEPVDDTAGQPD